MKFVAAPTPPRPLNLRGGAKLRMEVSRMAGNRLLLRIVAVISGKEIEVSRYECETEAELWMKMTSFASDRLCDLADVHEANQCRSVD